MLLEKILRLGKKERHVTVEMRRHIELLCEACDTFRTALVKQDRNLMRQIEDLEREADSLRRDVVAHLYEGAFLPYIRPDLCKFVETVDAIFDLLEDTVSYYLGTDLPEQLREEAVRIAFLNFRMSEMLLLSFDAMEQGADLREKLLAIRIYEKKVDDLKFSLIDDARRIPVDFWDGKMLSDFISGLTSISDVIEDASDHLQIINVLSR
jgi:hypothetical protein